MLVKIVSYLGHGTLNPNDTHDDPVGQRLTCDLKDSVRAHTHTQFKACDSAPAH